MDPLTSILIAVGLYVILFPLLFWGIGLIDKQLKNKKLNKQLMRKGANKNSLMRGAPEPAWPKWRERLKFTRADKRQFVLSSPKKGKEPKTFPISRRMAYWLIRAAGLVVAIIGGAMGNFGIVAIAAIVYFIGIIYGYKSADRLMKAREAIYARMFAVSKTKLGQSVEYENNPQSVIRIVEWRDFIKPQKVEFDIPDSFGEEGAEGFMKQFNQLFGRETAWVPTDNEETGDSGWDFDKGVLTIGAVPPLPRSAPWDEHYVLADGVAWSFFPIGLGVEHGLELPNPKTGETENVLGFDLSGEQGKVAEKFGLKMSQAITTSPMALIAGGTGGGKAMANDTPIRVVERPTPKVSD